MTHRPVMYDLFCGAGGAAMGYHRAGFRVIGFDVKPQPRYPFEFHQADALTVDLSDADAVHASPPCQAFTQAQRLQGRAHPDLIDPIRGRLIESRLPSVIENVPGAPLRADLILCGSMFGLDWENCTLYRHRLFEAVNWRIPPFPPAACRHHKPAISIFGHSVLGASKVKGRTYKHPNERIHLGTDVGREVMGIDWMNRAELSEAIPPAYTHFIGEQLLAHLAESAA